MANFSNLGSSTTPWNWTSSQIDPRQLTLATTPPPLYSAQHQSSPGLCAQPPRVQLVQNRERSFINNANNISGGNQQSSLQDHRGKPTTQQNPGAGVELRWNR